jgi:hypothetical protein
MRLPSLLRAISLRRTGLSTLLLALVLPGALPGSLPGAEAGISGLHGADVPWKHLHYEASRGIATLNIDLDLQPLSRTTLTRDLPAHEGLPSLPLPAKSVEVYELRAKIHLKHLFGDYATDDKLWFRSDDLGAIQREKTRSGNKEYVKTYRYQPTGTHRLRIRPEGRSERKKPSSAWTDRNHSFYNYSQALKYCKIVSEPGLLFFVAAAHDFSDNQPVQVCVFSDDSLFRMTIEPVGDQTIDVDYKLKKNGKQERIKGKAKAMHLHITAKKLPGGSKKADFEILDFKGSQELYIDPKRRIPLRISGSLPGMGKGNVDISSVTLR